MPLTDEQRLKIIREYIARTSDWNSRPDMNSERHLMALTSDIERAATAAAFERAAVMAAPEHIVFDAREWAVRCEIADAIRAEAEKETK